MNEVPIRILNLVRLNHFKQNFNNINLSEYYDLKKTPYEQTNIEKEIHSDFILLSIQYKKTYPCPRLNILPEIMQLIHEYLIYQLDIKIKIQYSSDYPFAPPLWFIQGVKYNFSIPISLLDYYLYKVNQHNKSYTTNLLHMLDNPNELIEYGWIPAITVEKDILSFIQKIYHFDELLTV